MIFAATQLTDALRRLEPRPPGNDRGGGGWLKRIPRFTLAGDVAWSEGTVRGPRQLPINFSS